MPKRTPLHDLHVGLKAKMGEFAGWCMPLWYTSWVDEHECVRTRCGIFDVSHMGQILCYGERIQDTLNYLTTNDVTRIPIGSAQYNIIANHTGGSVDDIIIYRLDKFKYLLCVNAINLVKDLDWLITQDPCKSHFEDVSDKYALLAVQGPLVVEYLKEALKVDIGKLARFSFIVNRHEGDDIIISRTGYTGSDGVEIFVSPERSHTLWELLTKTELGGVGMVKPCGLAARDTLRIEACLPLYGHELLGDISVFESGLGKFVALDKGDFVGKDLLARQYKEGVRRKIVPFEVLGKGIVRDGNFVFNAEGDEIGWITSGCYSPMLKKAIGMAMLDIDNTDIGSRFYTEVRGKTIECVVTDKHLRKKRRHI